jgi:colanic acid/amylovoran biosynthesis glycosyltransferase
MNGPLRLSVYRLQLFKPSETFVASQAKALPPSCVPQLLGRQLFGPPDNSIRYWTPPNLRGLNLARFLLTSSPRAFEAGVAEHDPQLIHAHFSVDGLYALSLSSKLDIPLITTLHGFDVTTSRSAMAKTGRPALVRYAYLQDRLKQRGTHFICVSRFILEAALRAGFPEERLSLHYIGIDPSQFRPVPATQPSRLVHVARLVEKKGTRYLLEAAALLKQRRRDFVLDIIGDGPLRSELEHQAGELGIERQVRFHGVKPHDEVRQMLQGACALVLPSVTAQNGDAEGLGLVLLEASASAVPVVGTRHGGIPEAISEGRSGLLVPERDSDALAEAIDMFLSDGEKQAQMGAAARQFVCEQFDIRKQSIQLETLYRRIC